MKRLRNVGSVLGAAAVIMAAGACGSNAGSPLGASDVRGATIQGTVVSPAATGQAGVSASSSAAGLTVSVLGTSLSTVTDGSGRFSLAGVPEGSATLQFSGAGIDARLQVSGLSAGQVLTISVQVSGSNAVLTPSAGATPSPNPTPSPNATPSPDDHGGNGNEPGDDNGGHGTEPGDDNGGHGTEPGDDNGGGTEAQFTGSIQRISAPDLLVAGRMVHTSGSTRILDKRNNAIAFSSLATGQTVEVEGITQRDGSVNATKVKLDD